MTIRLEMLRCFQAVARQGTLAGAAGVLGRTPSAVSMMLAQFQQTLGADLFESDRKNRLTPLGLRVLEEADRALGAFDRSVQAMGRHAQSTAGTVRLAVVPSVTVALLPRAIAAFRAVAPEVRLEISDSDTVAVIRHLQFDEADLGVVSGPVGQQGPGLAAEVLRIDPLGIVCRRDGAVMAAGRDAGWGALRCEALIANPLCTAIDHPELRALLAASVLSARNTSTLLALLRRGLGATVLPRDAVPANDPDLAFWCPQDLPATRDLLMVRSEARALSPAAEAFAAILRETASAHADAP
jgi:DNA-binding transcriptional LysR family regulator